MCRVTLVEGVARMVILSSCVAISGGAGHVLENGAFSDMSSTKLGFGSVDRIPLNGPLKSKMLMCPLMAHGAFWCLSETVFRSSRAVWH